MADRSRCPQCRERVSPYAAGCAVCGADLDPRRWDTGPSVGQRAGSWLGALSWGGGASDRARWLVMLLIVAFVATPAAALLGFL
jgi:hypothetical protein